jgi:hypothetical protein
MTAQHERITIDSAYPWGRSFDEYTRMFALSADDLSSRIIGCADGPASFNAELNRRGGCVISCDPLYQFSAEEISSRIRQTRDLLVNRARQNAWQFVWDSIRSPENLSRLRTEAMTDFLADYPSGRQAGRYLPQSLPQLDFPDRSFDLALCSHFLFLYSETLSLEFHIASIAEMCRLAQEVRIFPLLDMRGIRSAHLTDVFAYLSENGFEAQIEPVPYEFLRGANQMLRIKTPGAN